MTVPNRMPPTPAGRAKNVATTHASLSGQGQTKAARPVTDNKRQAQVYHPPTVQIGFDRLTAYVNIPAASLTGTSLNIAAWDGTFDVVGTSAALRTPDDGGIYLFAEGIYAVSASLRVDVSGATSAASVMHLAISSSEINLTPEAIWHGANEVAGNTSLPISTVVQYAPGHGLSGGLFTLLFYPAVDAAVTGANVTVSVTRVR